MIKRKFVLLGLYLLMCGHFLQSSENLQRQLEKASNSSNMTQLMVGLGIAAASAGVTYWWCNSSLGQSSSSSEFDNNGKLKKQVQNLSQKSDLRPVMISASTQTTHQDFLQVQEQYTQIQKNYDMERERPTLSPEERTNAIDSLNAILSTFKKKES